MAHAFGGVLDGRDLSSAAQEIRSDDVAVLVGFLMDPGRRLPVVVTSVAIETGRPSTDPHLLADQLIGIAHVFAIATAPATCVHAR